MPVAVLLATALLNGSCSRHPSGDQPSSATSASAQARASTLVVRDDSSDLFITWVDEAGEFRVAQKPSDVPESARERVRVVSNTLSASSPDQVVVADLRNRGPDGTYPTSRMSRVAWEELGASRRKSRLEALAPAVSSQSNPAAPTQLVATIYGAKWCKACREAARYLGQKGISVLEKDVDESPVIQAELRAKLSQAHLPPTSSIPVVDIGGRIIVGFSPEQMDAALAAAGNAKTP
jgi:arsenate reductase-like glutaredoxin family protein